MKRIFIYSVLAVALGLSSCAKDTDINAENPNQFSGADAKLIMPGATMANILVQEGELARLAGIFSGYFTGNDRQYISYQQYAITAGDFDNAWATLYAEGLAQCRIVREKAKKSNDLALYGVASITEANLLLTASGLWGDVPCTEACTDGITTPKYDDMNSVHNYCIDLLTEVLPYVSGKSSYSAGYAGGHDWGQVASTLIARARLRQGDYAGAAAAAANGVAEGQDLAADHSTYAPGAWNLYYDFLDWNRGGYMSCDGAYIVSVIDAHSNAKTDESGRRAAYFYDGNFAYSALDPNFYDGVFNPNANYSLVGYVENQMILAECAIRGGDAATALTCLNNVRAYNANMYGGTFDAYTASDFATPTDLAKELATEKYISMYGHIEGFTDVRRMKNAQGVPANIGSSIPARFLFPQSEVNTNKENVPMDQLDAFLPLTLFK